MSIIQTLIGIMTRLETAEITAGRNPYYGSRNPNLVAAEKMLKKHQTV